MVTSLAILSMRTEILTPGDPRQCKMGMAGGIPAFHLGEMQTRDSQSELAEETSHVSELWGLVERWPL